MPRQMPRFSSALNMVISGLLTVQVIEDASATVNAIPEATAHKAGPLLDHLRHTLVEGLRTFLQV